MTPEPNLYAPLRAEMLHRIPHCTGGSCKQGRDDCETKEACGLPLDGAAESAMRLYRAMHAPIEAIAPPPEKARGGWLLPLACLAALLLAGWLL